MAERAPANGAVGGETLTWQGRARGWTVYLPSVVPAGPMPVVMGLHGGGGSAEQFARSSRLAEVAEADGFLAVFPEGVPARRLERLHTWNAGSCCGNAVREGVDDVGYLDAVLDRVSVLYPIDLDRVSVIGHSNGGMMAYRYAAERSARVSAIGVVGATVACGSCMPRRPVSLLHIHGSADRSVPLAGGSGPRTVSRAHHRAPRDGVEAWARADVCNPVPLADCSGDLTTMRWMGGLDDTEVRFVVIDGASHAWPGSHETTRLQRRLVGRPYAGLDATVELCRFVLAHPRRASAPVALPERHPTP